MSITINFNNKENDYKEEIPLFFTNFSNGGDIWMLIRDKHQGEEYRVLSLENGHVQSGQIYSTFEDFKINNPKIKILNINVEASYK